MNNIKEALEIYVALYGREIYIADNIKVADVLDLINQYENEIDRLKTNREHSKLIVQRLKEKILSAKAKAIKDFAERLMERIAVVSFNTASREYADGYFDAISWVDEQIYNLLNETGVE